MTRDPKTLCLIIVSTFLLWFISENASGSILKERRDLLGKYQEIKEQLVNNDLGFPIYIESIDENNAMRSDIYGIIDHPFDKVQREFRELSNWCDIVSLHLNIKACTYRNLNKTSLLTLYCGRKFYEPPEDTFRLQYEYHLATQNPEYLHISLTADEGPYGTKDHRIDIEAIPLEKEKTLIHFSYGYIYGGLIRTLMRGYISTLGRSKIGFSVVKTDDKGETVYVKGVRGIIERNSVRYYLAIHSYMDVLEFPKDERFEKRIGRWYDLTDRYKKQLFEIKREKYLRTKRREHRNQLRLQRELHQ